MARLISSLLYIVTKRSNYTSNGHALKVGHVLFYELVDSQHRERNPTQSGGIQTFADPRNSEPLLSGTVAVHKAN